MFVVRPWQLHQFGNPHVAASQIVWVLFDVGVRRPHEDWLWPDWLGWSDRDTARLTTLLSRNEQHVLNASRDVARSFHEIAEIVAEGDVLGSETRMRLNISMMLLRFMEQMERQDPDLDEELTSSKRTVQIFLQRLQHALDENWTLENMAAECSLSRTQFSQHCQALTKYDTGALLADDPPRGSQAVAQRAGQCVHYRDRHGRRLLLKPVFRHLLQAPLRADAAGNEAVNRRLISARRRRRDVEIEER